MMRSTYNNNNNHDEDDFAPNPFRSGGGTNTTSTNTNTNTNGNMDFFETPSTTVMNHSHMNTNINYTQPDPNTGMVGTVESYYYPTASSSSTLQPSATSSTSTSFPATYLTGTMDQLGGTNPNRTAPAPGGAPNNNNNTNNILYSWLTSCCLPYDTIQSLFDVDTIDIYIRIKATIMNFHQPNYFRLHVLGTRKSVVTNHPNQSDMMEEEHEETDGVSNLATKGPDLYGPIWISMTCMFLLGITANINDYYRHVQQQQRYQNRHHNNNQTDTGSHTNETIDEEFEYDLTHLLNAMYICFMYTFGISTFFWLVCICMGFNNGQHNSNNTSSSKYLSWIYWVCHYGYSLVPILIGTCLAWILPYTLYHWIVLGTATFVSSLFIIRNLSTPLLEQDVMAAGGTEHDPNHGTFANNTTTTTTTTSTHAKAAPILLSILGVHFTFLLILKLTFYP